MDWEGIGVFISSIGIPGAMAVILVVIIYQLNRNHNMSDARSDGLAQQALATTAAVGGAIENLRHSVDALKASEDAKTDLFIKLANSSDKTYRQLETLTLVTESVIGSVDKLSTGVGDVHGRVANIETVMQAMRAMAEKNAEAHENVLSKLNDNALLLSAMKQSLDDWRSDIELLACIYEAVQRETAVTVPAREPEPVL